MIAVLCAPVFAQTPSREAGMFIEAEYFIDGAVTEENGNFRVSTRLIRTDTAELVAET
jgi:TolB-like protein